MMGRFLAGCAGPGPLTTVGGKRGLIRFSCSPVSERRIRRETSVGGALALKATSPQPAGRSRAQSQETVDLPFQGRVACRDFRRYAPFARALIGQGNQ